MSSLGSTRSHTAAPYALAAALVAALLGGCGSAGSASGPTSGPTAGTASTPGGAVAASPGRTMVLRDDANGKIVDVTVGTTLDLILSSSYWTVTGSSAPAVLRQDGSSKVLPRPSTCPHVPGLGCAPLETQFTALVSGTASITASRKVCGEARGCPRNEQNFAVTVVVLMRAPGGH